MHCFAAENVKKRFAAIKNNSPKASVINRRRITLFNVEKSISFIYGAYFLLLYTKVLSDILVDKSVGLL